MNRMEILFLIVSFIILVIIALIAIPALRKRGIDPDVILQRIADTSESLKATVAIVQPFLPENVALTKLDAVFELVEKGVWSAEQLCYIEKLPPEERKEYAYKYVTESLNMLDIPVTPEMEAVINGAIEAEVLSLGHKSK